MPSSPPSLSEAIERYIRFLQAEQNASALTVSNYRQSLELFLRLTELDSVFSINKESVRTYKQQLRMFRTRQNGELSMTTRNHHLTVLRAFLRYLIQEEELDVYPPDRIQRFTVGQRQVQVLQPDDLRRLLDAPDVSTRAGKRDKAILELFFSTGLRLSELRSLNRRDLNLQTREISVRGKRSKIRVVFLSSPAIDALTAYESCRTDALEPLFIQHIERASNAMPPGEEWRLSRISIYRIVKKYALSAGIVSDPSPHTLRHCFATDLLRNGADLRSVQEMLGHKDLSTTQIYTHVTNPQLKQVHEKFHGKQHSSD